MRVFLDTSVLVAAVVHNHEGHGRALALLDRVQNKKDEGIISAHTLAEVYAVLTRIPPPNRHSSAQALLSIEENIVKYFSITSLNGGEYAALLREAALAGIEGGTIYDAILLKCAEKSAAGKIFTLNLRHFQSISPPVVRSLIAAP